MSKKDQASRCSNLGQISNPTKIKNQSYRLINADIAQNCFKAIEKAVSDTLNTPHNVVVTIGIDDDKARSLAQNRLYWKWINEIEQQTGQISNDDDENNSYWHLFFKRLFLSRIYARDDGEFAEMAESIKRCKGVINDTLYENIATSVIKNISTTKANTKQFAEYLTRIELWAVANGLTLTTPQELEWVR